jgi:hypothetical protein
MDISGKMGHDHLLHKGYFFNKFFSHEYLKLLTVSARIKLELIYEKLISEYNFNLSTEKSKNFR